MAAELERTLSFEMALSSSSIGGFVGVNWTKPASIVTYYNNAYMCGQTNKLVKKEKELWDLNPQP